MVKARGVNWEDEIDNMPCLSIFVSFILGKGREYKVKLDTSFQILERNRLTFPSHPFPRGPNYLGCSSLSVSPCLYMFFIPFFFSYVRVVPSMDRERKSSGVHIMQL